MCKAAPKGSYAPVLGASNEKARRASGHCLTQGLLALRGRRLCEVHTKDQAIFCCTMHDFLAELAETQHPHFHCRRVAKIPTHSVSELLCRSRPSRAASGPRNAMQEGPHVRNLGERRPTLVWMQQQYKRPCVVVPVWHVGGQGRYCGSHMPRRPDGAACGARSAAALQSSRIRLGETPSHPSGSLRFATQAATLKQRIS
mmetsp:Transcript_19850/g.42295  ORF Transcript_19850/g.42295 Transcript_19850/m.42295 type:complete len:200 (-) Transcript_19850:257-856(-)